jgi:endonuclease YncB( thermonuclease family)
MFEPFQYRALVMKLNWSKQEFAPSTHDGDSAWLFFDKGNREYLNANCRFFGINTPERNAQDAQERDRANQARAFVQSMIDGKEVFVKSEKLDKYGRPLVLIWLTEEAFGDPKKSVNYEIIKAGFATPYYDDGLFSGE